MDPSKNPAESRGKSDIARMQDDITRFAAERDWHQFHDPKNLAMAIAVEAGELMDHFRWVRNEHALKVLDDPRTRAEVESEAADVMILLLEFATVCRIDIAAAVAAKMERNAERYPVELSKGRAVKHDRLRESR
jgi:dCTP diphosphatase